MGILRKRFCFQWHVANIQHGGLSPEHTLIGSKKTAGSLKSGVLGTSRSALHSALRFASINHDVNINVTHTLGIAIMLCRKYKYETSGAAMIQASDR